MFFEIDGKTYRVKFYRTGNMTFAELFRVETDGKLLNAGLDGVSVCNPNDKFEKAKGRKIALADLLDKMGDVFLAITDYVITKGDRARIWEAYFRSHNK